MSYTA